MNSINEALELFGYQFVDESGVLRIKEITKGELTVPENIAGKEVRVLGEGLFFRKQLESVILPKHLEVIGENAFRLNWLTEVIIPVGTKRIESLAFSDNPLSYIVIPNTLEYIDEDAFDNTTQSLTIVCQKESYAHKFAERYGFTFKVLTEKEFNSYY